MFACRVRVVLAHKYSTISLNTNVINSVLGPILFCLVVRNISVPVYFGVPFQSVSGSLKKYIIYILLILYKIMNLIFLNLK